jgi:hypothetical protein
VGSYQAKFHTTRFNHVVVDELESSILSKEVLQKVEVRAYEDQQAK